MAEEKFVLVSLEDERTGELAIALSNKTCKMILDLLAEKELSETEISKSLSIPLNTAEYNIKKLVKAGLIEEKKHFFSVKGKRIPVYKISNKHIVISPKKTSFSKLKTSLPVVIIAGIFTGFILWMQKSMSFVQDNIRQGEMLTSVGEEAVKSVNFVSNLNSVKVFLIIIWILIIIFVAITIVRRSK